MTDIAALHRKLFELTPDWGALEQLFHTDFTYTDASGIARAGAATSIDMAREYYEAFPDVEFEFLQQNVVGDTSILEVLARATHTGPLMGLPPTGKRVQIQFCSVVEFRDGKCYAEREYVDSGEMMRQLGSDRGDFHRDIVESIYDAFGRGDIEEILGRLSPDVEWDTDMSQFGLPWYTPRRGHEGVAEFFRVLDENLEFTRFEPVAIMASDDHVAALVRFELTIKATGRSVSDTEVHVWRFGDDDRVAGLVHVVDQHAQLLAYDVS